MPRAEPVTLTMLTPIEAPEPGWCQPCALNSMLRWQVAVESPRGFFLATVGLCTDCGAEEWL